MFGLSDVVLKIVGAVAAAIALFGFGYYKGHHSVQVVFDQYKAEVVAASNAQIADTAKKDAKTSKLITETKNAYISDLANLRAYYRMRLNQSGSTMPEASGTPGGADGYSPDNLPPAPILAAQCAETTLTLVKLQAFERKKTDILE